MLRERKQRERVYGEWRRFNQSRKKGKKEDWSCWAAQVERLRGKVCRS
jgi:hypothetical protein